MIILAITGVMAIGKDKIKRLSVTFASNVTVNGSVVKAGDYDVKFDEQSGEFQVLRGGKVVAKATAHMAPRTDNSHETKMNMKNDALVSIATGGDEITIGDGNSASE
jgi:hypothetical protein